METSENTEDILNSLINTNYIDLGNVEATNLNELSTDDILKETQKLVNDAIKNKTIEEFIPSGDTKDSNALKEEKEEPSIKINTAIESNIVEEDAIPSKYLSNPIDFVNYIEYQLPKDRTRTKQNAFVLKKYENEKNKKFFVSELNPLEELSLLLLKGYADITATMAFEDNFITGDILGDIKFYSLKDLKLTKKLPCPLKQKVQINTIDLSDDGDYVFAGYANGNIVVYELTTNKCKLINNTAHKTGIINIKFIEKNDKKVFRIFTCDEEGNILDIVIKAGIFGFSTSKVEAFGVNKNNPPFIMHLLKFKENELKNRSFLQKINKSIIIGNLENIHLFALEPKVKKIFTLPKPSQVRDSSIPDVAIGLGKPPTSNESYAGDEVELQILLIISWDKVIYLYIIPFLNKDLLDPLLTGYYVNENQIIRIGFLNISTIYLIDKKGNYKVLNTGQFNLGMLELKPDILDPIIPDDNKKSELQDTLKFEGNILKQMNLKTPNGGRKETYINTIINNITKEEFNVLTNKYLYHQQLLDYQKYLKDLQKKEKWMELLILGMYIFQGRMTALNGIPVTIKERKKAVGGFLQDVISQFLFTNSSSQQASNNNKNNYFDPSLENERIEKNMEITIEFCIEIESVDYLFDKILKIYESKKYKEIFLSKLEPFILCDKMIKFEIPEEIVLDLIKLYESQKKLDTLSQLLMHINVKSLDVPSVRQKIENLFLTTPFIYLCVNGNPPDYFEPVLRIYDKFINSNEIPNFVSYENLISTKALSLKEIKTTKQYLGHKLFWYIRKSLTGKKFPNYNEPMDEEMYRKAISKITYWLLNDDVLYNLILFEPKTYFDIFTYILLNDEIIKLLEDNNNFEDRKKEAFEMLKKKENSSYSYVNIMPSDLANHLIMQGNRFGNSAPIIFLYLCIFIVTIGKKMNLKAEDKKEAIKYIISTHHKFGNINLDIPKLIRNIINTLDDCEFNQTDYNEILSVMTTHTFDEVKLYILKKNHYYKECLELYLDEASELKNKRQTLFPFINLTLTKLKMNTKKDQNIFKEFKDAIMNNLIVIGEISMNELYNLVETYYSKEKKEVLNKLSEKPETQLKYVEILVEKINNSLRENEGILVGEEPEWVDAILNLHLQLLCYLNKKDKVLPSLKACSLYPLNESLSLCLKCQIYDALIFLYKKVGYIDKALEVCLQLLIYDYEAMFENLKADEFKENLQDLKIMDFTNIYNEAINILEENEKALSDDHQVWFTFLDYIYKLVENYPNQKLLIPEGREKFGEELEKLLSDKLKHLLETMSTYVGVIKILDIMCEKNKNASFKELKPFFIKMLQSFGNQTHLLNCVKKYLIHTCLQDQSSLQELNIKGKDIDFNNCDVCLKNFSKTIKEKEKISVFTCNHIEHEYCAFNGGEKFEARKICPICLKEEIDDAITCSREDPRSSLSYEEFQRNNSKNINIMNKRVENKVVIFKYNKGFAKMRGIDNYNIIKRNMFYYDSANSCRDFYRRKVFDD